MARATSVRPAPMRPAKPRISPAFTEKLTSRISRPRLSPFTSKATGASAVLGMTRASLLRVRPTIMEMMVSMGVSAPGTVPTYSPSRMMVTRSEMRLISSILWLI
ncbi:hypothetical protein D9M68_1005130 [compost metagenome]